MRPIVCFGEMLWDLLPAGRQPGGAPLNVAVHLHQLGQPARLSSRIGPDEWGQALLAFLAGRGLATDLVQLDPTQPTGTVQVNVTDREEVSYNITQPVAWDFIDATPALQQAVAEAEMLVYGSLASRAPTSRAALHALLPATRLRVFDLNLRPPHYTRAEVEFLLTQADLVKLNHHELAQLAAWLNLPAPEINEAATLAALAKRAGLQAACVTRGAAGAALWTGNHFYETPGVAVRVQDTIGSGDAFLAAFLASWVADQPPADCLHLATAAGALVATQAGATPELSLARVRDFMAGG